MPKAKTLKKGTAKIAIAFNEKGYYDAYGVWSGEKRPTDESLTRDMRGWNTDPYLCIVDVELNVPGASTAKVVKVKAVKR